ncbi:MAG TPA: hypothetical protein VF731_14735 [Solirubrobacterales bacterium]
MSLSEPIYLDSAPGPAFALLDLPAGEATGTPVLFCPPWGWDEVASYRVRREWAQGLAAAGHPTLRLSLPATGNSGGMPGDPGLVESWIGSIAGAASWLGQRTGGDRLAAVGLGLGGALTIAALAESAPIDALALWAVPASGRHFIRETTAFSRMQAWHAETDGEDPDAGMPEGWLEAGGFLLAPETMAAIRALRLDLAPEKAPSRALILGRDAVAPDAALAEKLREAGTEVTLSPGPGWGAMTSHPERAVLPAEVVAELGSWLRDEPAGAARGGSSISLSNRRAEVEVAAPQGPVREAAWMLEQPWGNAFGVLSRPEAEPAADLCAVFLDAGAVRNTGPSRLWVETARSWAARGVPSLRVDLEGIGEADGEPSPGLRVRDFYQPRFGPQVGAVLDELSRRGVGSRFLLVGLCAGGYWGFRVAVEDPRVRAAFLLNAGALRWHDDLIAEREARKAPQALQGSQWRRLFAGEVSPRRALDVGGAMVRGMVRGGLLSFERSRGHALLKEVEGDLDRLRDSGTDLLVAFSGSEALAAELEASAIPGQVATRWPNVELTDLPGDDHSLRPYAVQVAARRLLDDRLGRLLQRRAATPSSTRA